jgi:multisubunit Na+/H+ antiporter MnhF subunit
MQEMLIVSIAVVISYKIIVTTEIADRIIAMLHNVFKTIVIVIVIVLVSVNNLEIN